MSIILDYNGTRPTIHSPSFVAHNAVISGKTTIEKNVGIWYSCTVRGDVAEVHIGENTNVQDNTVIHVTRPHHKQNKTGEDGGKTVIGSNVTIGHSCIVHACTIEDNTFIGMGSIVMDLARVEKNGMLAAGSTLTTSKIVKSGELWAGSPAKFFRMLTQEEIDYIQTSANNYWALAQEYIISETNLKKPQK